MTKKSGETAKKKQAKRRTTLTQEQIVGMYDLASALAIGTAFRAAQKTGKKVTLVIEPKVSE